MLLLRTTEYRYNADGKLVELTLRNEATGDEVTRWEYGVTKADGEIASNELLRAKIYPDSDDGRDDDGWDGVYDRVEYRYNVAGELVRQKDQNGTVHEYGYDKLGRLVADRVTEFGDGIDDAVLAIGRSYDVKGQLEKVTSYEDADMEVERDQVQFAYDGFGQVTEDYQEHEGAVDVEESRRVSYEYATGGAANTARLEKMEYARTLAYDYGTAGEIDDLLDRVRAIRDDVSGPMLARYTKRGRNATVKVEYPAPQVELTYIKEEGEPDGDAGDQYTGLDRFNRIEDVRWINRFGETPYDVDRYQYGFDRAGNRLWRRNVVQAGQGFDESYGYDGLYQLTDLERGNLNINRTAVGATPIWEEAFNYDPAGNWQRYATKVGGVANLIQSRQHNRANEITFIDGTNLQVGHDRAGNMTRMPQVGHWETAQKNTWDAWNRLVRVQEGETVVGEYAYDGLTRRIWKRATFGDTTYTRHGYFSIQWQLLEERYSPEDEAPERIFVWGMRYIDDLVLRECLNYDPIQIYATHDQWHVTALLTSDGGAAVERYCYSAFGSPTVMDGDWVEREESIYDWETRYGAYRWDQETGLYCVRYRYLHSNLGRWMSRDPIAEFGGPNQFAYVKCNPTNAADAFGLIGDNDNTGTITWSVAPCCGEEAGGRGQIETRFIQAVVYSGIRGRIYLGGPSTTPPWIDNRLWYQNFWWSTKPPTPFYPTRPGFFGIFEDTPGGLHWSTFEVCRVCFHKGTGKIVSIGPCAYWTYLFGLDSTEDVPGGVSLHDPFYPRHDIPSGDWFSALQSDYPDWNRPLFRASPPDLRD